MKKSQNCRRKLKLDSYDAEYHADAENALYVNIIFISGRARASAHEQKCIFRRRRAYAPRHAGADVSVEIVT